MSREEREKEIWKHYLSDRTNPVYIENILSHYTPIIVKIANDIMRKKPQGVELEDLVQCGSIGLLHALERFDPSKGVKFTTFMNLRVRGAMHDEINDLDWTPRSIRDKLKLVIKATDEYKSAYTDTPNDEQLSKYIQEKYPNKKITSKQVNETRSQMERTHIHNIPTEAVIKHENNVSSDIFVTIDSTYSTEHAVIKNEESAEMINIIKKVCNEEEQQVMILIFHKEMSIKSISQMLGVNSNKISNLKRSALSKIEEELLNNKATEDF